MTLSRNPKLSSALVSQIVRIAGRNLEIKQALENAQRDAAEAAPQPDLRDLRADIAAAAAFPAGFGAWLKHWRFKNRESGDVLTFERLWPGQAQFSDRMIDVALRARAQQEWLGIFALKAGKLGFTELECAWDGYVAWARRNGRIHLFSKEGESAKMILSVAKFGLQHMEAAWGIRFVGSDDREIRPDRAGVSTLRFAVLREGERDPADIRTLWAYSTGTFPSIDQSCMHAHIDEWAHMQDPSMVWGAVATTVAPGGTCHIVTRGAGENKDVEDVWKAATAGASKLMPYFAPYTSRPGRDDAWLQAEASSHPTTAALAHYAAETPDDAFLGDEDNDFVPIELWDRCFDRSLANWLADAFGPQTRLAENGAQERGRWVGNLLPGDKTTLVLSADAGVSHDNFGIVAASRHPERPDDPAIRLCKSWKPDDFELGVIDFGTVESWLRTVCQGGCVLGHPYGDPAWRYGKRTSKLVGQTWEPGECPACRAIDQGDDGARVQAFNVYEVVYDPYQLADMMQSLRRDGIVYCKEMIQSGPRLTSDRKLYDMVIGGRLGHCGDQRLREHVQNSKAKTQKDEESKLRIVKKAAHRRIDLCVAASMAVSEVMRLTL